jgi:hypothetical protein
MDLPPTKRPRRVHDIGMEAEAAHVMEAEAAPPNKTPRRVNVMEAPPRCVSVMEALHMQTLAGVEGQDLDQAPSSCVDALLQMDASILCIAASELDDNVLCQLVERVQELSTELARLKTLRVGKEDEDMGLKHEAQLVPGRRRRRPERRRSLRLMDKACSIPTEVIRQVTRSEFLTSEEAGRLLLLTCSSIPRDYGGPSSVWQDLCLSKWKNSLQVPQSLIKPRGYEWLFRQKSQGLARRLDWPALPPPTLQPSQLQFLISITKNNKEIVSQVLEGDKLEQLFTAGEVAWTLPEPVRILDDLPRTSSTSPSSMDQYSASIHALRLDTNACCCVHDTTLRKWSPWKKQGEENERMDASCYNGKPIGSLGFRNTYIELDLTDLGHALEHRIQRVLDPSTRFDECDPYKGFHFRPTLLCVESPTDNQMHFTQLKVAATYFSKSGDSSIYNSQEQTESHGVSLMHLVEQLYGWEAESTTFGTPRFPTGTRVSCRMGPDPNQDWAQGTIIQLWYRESKWPTMSFAPYKIRLDDGQFIFAPADIDRVIRLTEEENEQE